MKCASMEQLPASCHLSPQELLSESKYSSAIFFGVALISIDAILEAGDH